MRAPFVGRMPNLGDKVMITLGAGYGYAEGIVSHLSSEHISLLLPEIHDHKRYRLIECERIEILEEH